METILNLKQWGNSLGMRLPVAITKEAHLYLDQRVKLVVEKGRVVITPIVDDIDSLEQRLAKYDPNKHGVEEMEIDEFIGAEKL